MTGAEITSISGVIVVGMGLVATWIKNGRGHSREMGGLKEQVDNIDRKLEDVKTSLDGIKESVDGQRLYCARVSSSHEERIKTLEKGG